MKVPHDDIAMFQVMAVVTRLSTYHVSEYHYWTQTFICKTALLFLMDLGYTIQSCFLFDKPAYKVTVTDRVKPVSLLVLLP